MFRSILILPILTAAALHAQEPDWNAFEDPKAVFLQESVFTDRISTMPEREKADAIGRVGRALASTDMEVRRRAALLLANLGDPRGVPVMMADMKTADPSQKDNIVVALRIMKDRRAVPVLREALADESPYVRQIALCALGEMKAVESLPEVAGHLQDKQRFSGCFLNSPAQGAAYALQTMGDPKAIPYLIQALDDRDIRQEVVSALSSLSSKKFGGDVARWKSWWKEAGKE